MSKTRRCGACGKRLRPNHHELLLSDYQTGQVIGHYHAGLAHEGCQAEAAKYTKPGVVLQASFVHPARCGDEMERCGAGLGKVT